MIATIIQASINNRFLVLLLTALLIAGGLYAYRSTPIDAIPDLSDVQVIIKTSYPGQAPQVVQDQVTYPLSTAMLSVPGAVTVRGFSFYGDSFVYVIFDEGTDLYWARSRVLEYLSQVAGDLPREASPRLGPDATGVGWVYSYALVDHSGKQGLAELRSLQDWFLRYELQTVPGVAEVAAVGGMVKQYQVVLDPYRMRSLGIPLAHVKQAIQRSNQESGAALVEMAEAEYMVRVTGYLHGVEDLRKIPLGLAGDGNPNDKLAGKGVPLLLEDIADVTEGPQARRGIAELNGEGEVVGGIVVMRAGANAQATIAGVKTRLAALKAGLPAGVELVTTYDRSALIERAVDNLKDKLIEEFVVVALICLVFLLHLRSALVVLISLPVAVLAAFVVMHYQGLSFNIMSLGGIAIAVGAMVDGAIVMIENLHKHIEHQSLNRPPDQPPTTEERWQLVATAATEVGKPLFFSLLIITLSFLPVFTLQAQEGKLFSPLAFTKTYAMAAAAILAITLVPVLMGYFVRGRILPERRNPVNRLLLRLYRPVLQGSLRFPWLVLLLAAALLLPGVWMAKQVGSEFMPPLDEGDLMYMPTTYAALSIEEARVILQRTDRMIRRFPEVKSVFGKIGRAETATDPAPLTMIETIIQFKPRSEWRPGLTPDKLRAELAEKVRLPGLSNAWVMPIKTRIDMLSTGIKTPVGIKISGPDLKVIEGLGKQLEKLMPQVAGTESVYAERVAGGRYLVVDINRAVAARFGLNIADVQDVVRSAVGGFDVGETIEGQARYPINLRYPQALRNSPERLANLPLQTPAGAWIPLGDLAEVRVEDGPPGIKSENGRLNGWVLVDIAGRDVGSYVAEARTLVSKALQLPAGYALNWSGQYEYMQRAKARLQLVVPLTLAVIVLLLYLNFRSLPEILIILGTLPLALLGGLGLVWLLGFNLSVAVGVGFIALAGVAVEIGVLMLAYLNMAWQDRQAALRLEGRMPTLHDLREAVMQGAALRIRPISMAAAAIMLGLVPILLGDGTGSDVMRRIAAPMLGGMLTTLPLALVVIPGVFYLWRAKGLGAFRQNSA